MTFLIPFFNAGNREIEDLGREELIEGELDRVEQIACIFFGSRYAFTVRDAEIKCRD